jgi:hypothetical protein
MVGTQPNPFTTLVLSLASIVFWFLTIYYWAHYNDHWALFWFALSISLANVVSSRVRQYREMVR